MTYLDEIRIGCIVASWKKLFLPVFTQKQSVQEILGLNNTDLDGKPAEHVNINELYDRLRALAIIGSARARCYIHTDISGILAFVGSSCPSAQNAISLVPHRTKNVCDAASVIWGLLTLCELKAQEITFTIHDVVDGAGLVCSHVIRNLLSSNGICSEICLDTTIEVVSTRVMRDRMCQAIT